MEAKNIHVVAKDKPSRLFIIDDKLYNYHKPQKGDGVNEINQNIYITSDEEIKEGDWYALFMLDKKTKYKTTKFDCIVKADLDKTNEYLVEPYSQYCKKIILTTDQDLIKDGVQAIDDEFLEWFVKNPSCEEVETKLVEFEVDKGYRGVDLFNYKIIIPSEEPKQETTLEEALLEDIKFLLLTKSDALAIRLIEKYGHNKQQERSYSEAIDLFITEIKNEFKDDNWDYLEFVKERVVEQFKNK